jgi:hypothetical protein
MVWFGLVKFGQFRRSRLGALGLGLVRRSGRGSVRCGRSGRSINFSKIGIL